MAKSMDNLTEVQLRNLGARLKQLRIERGYTNYEQFAFDHELPRAQYGRYEKGQDLRFSSLVRVLSALEISLKDFFQKDLIFSTNTYWFSLLWFFFGRRMLTRLQ